MRFVAFLSRDDDARNAGQSPIAQWLQTGDVKAGKWQEMPALGPFRIWRPRDELSPAISQLQSSGGGSTGCNMIGFAFRKTDEPIDPPLKLNEDDIEKVIASQGAWFFQNNWGQYLTFAYDRKSDTQMIIRDPTGSISCYFAQLEPTVVFFSDLPDVAALLPRFTLNDRFISAAVVDARFDKSITGLEGIGEVLPGEIWTPQTDPQNRCIAWSPYDHLEFDRERSLAESAANLKSVLKKTVATLASRYDTILLPIGGLDSSVILTCLMDAPSRPEVRLFTFATDKKGGDETLYTRAAVDHFALDLNIYQLDSNNIDFDLVMASNKQPKPQRVFDFGDLAGRPDRFGTYKSVEAVFTGVGGDTLLFQSSAMFPVADFVHHHGFASGFWHVLLSTMRASQLTLQTVLMASLSEYGAKDTADDFIRKLIGGLASPQWFSKSIHADMPDLSLIHPALRSDRVLPKGKVMQATSNCFAPMPPRNPLNFFGDLPHHHAFLCQPVIEAALQIPSWQLAMKGLDRGLVRYAFKDELPEIVLRRFTKGTPEQIYLEFLNKHMAVIRDTIVSGHCWDLDVFSDEWRTSIKDDEMFFEIPNTTIFHILNIESWAMTMKTMHVR
jgi:asparagine synthase (glutamine-hydrolysing)